MNEDKKIDIGLELLQSMYADTKFVTKDSQPYYILARDTIGKFLYEKEGVFTLKSKLISFLGIELTLILALITTNFKTTFNIDGTLWHAIFIVSAFVNGIYLLLGYKKWNGIKKSYDVDVLTEELGKRGSILDPGNTE